MSSEFSVEQIDELRNQYINGPRYWTAVGSIIGAVCLAGGIYSAFTILKGGAYTEDLLIGAGFGLIGLGLLTYAAYKFWQSYQAEEQLNDNMIKNRWNEAQQTKLVQEAAFVTGWSTMLKPGFTAGFLTTAAITIYEGITNDTALVSGFMGGGIAFLGLAIFGSLVYNYYRASEAMRELEKIKPTNAWQFPTNAWQLIGDYRKQQEQDGCCPNFRDIPCR